MSQVGMNIQYGTQVTMTPIPVNPYASLTALRTATAALLALATQVNTRVQATTTPLTTEQQQRIAADIATATANLQGTKSYLKI